MDCGKRAEQGGVGTFAPWLTMRMEGSCCWHARGLAAVGGWGEVTSLCRELDVAHLHLRNLVAIVVPSPRIPVDTICKATMGTPKVEAIQI